MVLKSCGLGGIEERSHERTLNCLGTEVPGEQDPVCIKVILVRECMIEFRTNLIFQSMASSENTSTNEQVLSGGIAQATSGKGASRGIPTNKFTTCIDARTLEVMGHPIHSVLASK